MATQDLPSISPASFREAMRHLAGSVTVITSRSEEHLNGMTATAVCSVSAEPPLILAVVNRRNTSHGFIARTGAFAVNLLAEEQSELASFFARPEPKTFDGIDHALGATGCPLLTAAVLQLECVLHSSHHVETHTLFIGRVTSAMISPMAPLLYHNGQFGRLSV